MHSIVIPATNTAVVYDLTTVEAVNEALGIVGNSATDAATANEITAASKRIGEICDRVFAQQTVTETFRLHNHYTHALPLFNYPVIDVASVTVDGSLLSSDNYEVNPDNGLLYRVGIGCWGWHWPCKIVVNYTGGYDLPGGAPASLAQACIDLIEDDHISGERDTSIRDIQHADRRVSYFNANVSGTNAALPAAVADLIKPFKRIVLA